MKYEVVEIGVSDFRTSALDNETDSILLVEPIQLYLDNLPDKSNITKANYGVSNKSDMLNIYYVKPEHILEYEMSYWVRGCNSIDRLHPTLLKEYGSLYERIVTTKKVKVITFQELIEIYNIEHIEYLKIDTEGMDHLILDSLLETNIRPNKIRFEYNILSNIEELEKIIKILNKEGYKGKQDGFDYEMIKK